MYQAVRSRARKEKNPIFVSKKKDSRQRKYN